MDLLIELAFVLAQVPARELDAYLPRRAKTRALFDAVASGQVTTDEDAAKLLYGASSKEKKYLMLKKSLLDKLQDLLINTQSVEISRQNYNLVKFACKKQLIIVEKLLLRNVYHSAEKILGKVWKQADSYHLTAVKLEVARRMRHIYYLKGYPTETAQHNEQVQALSRKLDYQERALGEWHYLASKTKFTIGRSHEVGAHAQRATEQIRQWLTEHDNPFLWLSYFRVEYIRADHQFDSGGLQDILRKKGELLQAHPYLAGEMLALELATEQARYHLLVREFAAAEAALTRSLGMSSYHAFTKFEVQALHFDMQMKQQRWEKAAQVLAEVYRQEKFGWLDRYDVAAWRLREAYLYYALLSSGAKEEELAAHTPNFGPEFNLQEFLQVCQPLSKDKTGYQMLVLIIRTLLLYEQHPEDTTHEGNNLAVYAKRYLQEDLDERGSLFFNLLSKAARANFSPDKLAANLGPLERKLALSTDPLYQETEWIPYETLWQFIVSRVREKAVS